MSLAQRTAAEALGTAFLLMAVVGSGIMAERLAGGNAALALLANAVATGGALLALILTYGPLSGAHFNPLVSLLMAARGELARRELPAYLLAQMLGAVLGVWAAHGMFELPLLQNGSQARSGLAQGFSEFIASFGLLMLVLSLGRHRPAATPFAVAAYITGAYWFTASTSFANPVVTLARAFTDSFAGIRLADVAGFVAAQLSALGAVIAFGAWLLPPAPAPKAGSDVI